MTYSEKINFLQKILKTPENSYSDSFKDDIVMYFDDNFNKNNILLSFLYDLNSEEKIALWLGSLLSSFVMKFDPEFETENDFIFDFIQNT